LTTALYVLAGYLAGSLPFGYWVVRVFKRIDIRSVGSGNIGATNVSRTCGFRWGLSVAILDVLKGFVPVLVATHYAGHLAGALAGAAAMLGHWRPLFMGFARGGKMVATCGGAFFGLAPYVGLVTAALWVVIFVLVRYASVASIVCSFALPVIAVALGEPWPVIVFAAGAGVAVLLLHRPNMSRLRAGTENRFKFRRPKRAAVRV
jgi:glycerol-3-phosphate acyltransferase PlsY